MGHFDPSKYASKEWDDGLQCAREDLEKDYPEARVFLHYYTSGSPSIVANEIRLAPPEGHSNVIRGSYMIEKWYGNYEYRYVIFSEGTLTYAGLAKKEYVSFSDGSDVVEGKLYLKTYRWRRSDGSTRFRTTSDIDLANWMSQLPDDRLISQLTIPGTHDSHALIGTPIMPKEKDPMYEDSTLSKFVKKLGPMSDAYAGITKAGECQEWDLETQLQNGVRHLDLRYGLNLGMRHGQLQLPGFLVDCLKIVDKFLEAHPRETIIVMAKWDYTSFIWDEWIPEDVATREAADKLFTDAPRFLDVKTIPTLGECRGRFIRGLEGPRSPVGLDFEAYALKKYVPKPEFKYPEFELVPGLSVEENGWRSRQWVFDKSWAGTEDALIWVLNARRQLQGEQRKALATTGVNAVLVEEQTVIFRTSIFPEDFAKRKNTALSRWLERVCSLAQIYELGIIGLDFPSASPELLKRLVLTNFA